MRPRRSTDASGSTRWISPASSCRPRFRAERSSAVRRAPMSATCCATGGSPTTSRRWARLIRRRRVSGRRRFSTRRLPMAMRGWRRMPRPIPRAGVAVGVQRGAAGHRAARRHLYAAGPPRTRLRQGRCRAFTADGPGTRRVTRGAVHRQPERRPILRGGRIPPHRRLLARSAPLGFRSRFNFYKRPARARIIGSSRNEEDPTC